MLKHSTCLVKEPVCGPKLKMIKYNPEINLILNQSPVGWVSRILMLYELFAFAY